MNHWTRIRSRTISRLSFHHEIVNPSRDCESTQVCRDTHTAFPVKSSKIWADHPEQDIQYPESSMVERSIGTARSGHHEREQREVSRVSNTISRTSHQDRTTEAHTHTAFPVKLDTDVSKVSCRHLPRDAHPKAGFGENTPDPQEQPVPGGGDTTFPVKSGSRGSLEPTCQIESHCLT